jgi:hypothetical protein
MAVQQCFCQSYLRKSCYLLVIMHYHSILLDQSNWNRGISQNTMYLIIIKVCIKESFKPLFTPVCLNLFRLH